MDDIDDWAARITALEARGWTLVGIGLAIGLSAQGVSDVKQKRTKAPGGMAAVRLHALHSTGALPPVPLSEAPPPDPELRKAG